MEDFLTSGEVTGVLERVRRWLEANGLSLEGGFWVWTATQIAIVITAYLLARLIASALNPRIEARLRQVTGKPRLLRFLVIAFRRYHWAYFIIMVWTAAIIMRAYTWPSRSYFLVVVANLATAWLVISILSRIIRNRIIANFVAVSAWTIAALNMFGILDDTIVLLDSPSVVLGEVRVSALLVINSLVLCSLLIWGALGISGLVERQLTQIEDLTPSVRVLVGKIFRIFILLVAILTGLNVVGIDLTALAVFSGALGLGIGFGLQKIVSNLLSGIILLMDKSIKPGDVIEIQTVSGTTYGWVEHLGARYTSVRTRDGIDTLFPNETFIATPVTNWSHGDPKVRQKLSVGVSYDSDVEKAIALCLEAAGEQERVLNNPAPRCLLVGFGESSIDLQLRFWLADPQAGLRNIASEIYLAIWRKFRDNGIEIPFPQRDLHVRSAAPLPIAREPQAAGRGTT